MFNIFMKAAIMMAIAVASNAFADGNLSPDIRISSKSLGYELQYRVYEPAAEYGETNLALLFVTDGQAYIKRGRMPRVLDRLIEAGEIEPLVVVFVDPRDPDDLLNNRRNQEFFCNRDYLAFYVDELIPRIEQDYPVARLREKRGILGVSFGALNAACFGLLGHEQFSAIGMHSPANHPVPQLVEVYEMNPTLPLRIFLSYGKPDDNTQANRRFRKVLQEKNYELEYIERRKGHDWGNWAPIIDDTLIYLFPATARPSPSMP